MKKLVYTAAVFTMLLGFASCDKTETPTPTTPTTPTNPTTPTTAGPQPVMPAPSGNNLSGALISLKMKYSTQPMGAPMPVTMESEMGMAIFYDNAGSSTKVDAGTVSVNSNDLEKKQDLSYFKWAYAATPDDLDFSSGSNWNVGSSSAVTAFTYNDNSTFPKYIGNMPTSITKSNGVTLTFNNSSLTGADSVYVVIASGSANVTKSFAANAGTVTISAGDLSSLSVVSDNSAVFEVCPFRWSQVTKNGKNYVFIKEEAVVGNININ